LNQAEIMFVRHAISPRLREFPASAAKTDEDAGSFDFMFAPLRGPNIPLRMTKL
jgi:hypothetical protein